ncbi:hypothetical protein [Tepidanaerobacter syntrophicus]|uniref:Aminotransferase class V-fold PLP-dependent enzyme n=1 Tax=Tepidanaerobacter syntrophicus TaxID=224999 RepID=A0A0U9HQH3_9FIRM|nr:hypothetical protein [Tepidanaerobacter syntrophicus]GAQ26145.1 hypothetical protein TSYNT_9404 [Tepidanaerobacter syntrophicus]HHV82136.1 hypothetical protein [Tepidanaerobacter syntrophicus]
MAKFTKKFEMYKSLQANIQNIYADARKAADEIGIPAELRGKFGLTGAVSGCPSPLTKKVREAMDKGATEVIPLATLVDQIRGLVKDVYGDDYDAAPINTCEAGLWVTFDALFTTPMQGRGDGYQARYIIPYEKHLHHHGGYGRPFPGRFKDILADRGATAGELGFYGKRQNNLSVYIAPLVGADYSVHGIKYHPAIQLTKVDPEASAKKIKTIAERQASMLTGITSLAYDTPGYGYGVKDSDGVPVLQKRLAEIAKDFDVPYVVDNAWGVPFIGHDIRKSGADVIIYSMDKASESPTGGLIIGKEEFMVPIRRALGMHGDRYGTTASYGKAAYVTNDPGKEAMLGMIAALKEIIDNPDELKKPVDDMYKIVKEEFDQIHPKIRKGLIISKSYNSRAIEVNYENTWNDGELGLPIFSIEDMYAGTQLLQTGLSQMGVIPTVAYDANIMISPGLGTTDEKGQIIESNFRYAVKAQVKLMEIVAKYSGFID